MHLADRSFQRDEESGCDVTGVHQRTPRCAVGQDSNVAGEDRMADQIVQHDVRAQPRREPERGGVAQEHRREGVVRDRGDVVLHADLALRVGRQRSQRSTLGDQILARRPVHRAGGGVEEPPDACLFRQSGQPDRGVVVDVVGDLRRQRAERVVGQCGEMDDRFEPVQLLGRHIPQVHLHARRIRAGPARARSRRKSLSPNRLRRAPRPAGSAP